MPPEEEIPMTTALVPQDAEDDDDGAMIGADQVDALAEAEDQIEQAKRDILMSWAEIGEALARVRNDRLYRAGGFKRFEDWTKTRFGLSKSHAYRLIEASTALSDIAARLGGASDDEAGDASDAAAVIPEAVLRTEHHARALLPLWRSNPEAAAAVVQDLASEEAPLSTRDVADAATSRLESGTMGLGASSRVGAPSTTPYEPGLGSRPQEREPGFMDFGEADFGGPYGAGGIAPERSEPHGRPEPQAAATLDPDQLAQALVEGGYALIGRAGHITSEAVTLPLTLTLPAEGGLIEVEVRFRPAPPNTSTSPAPEVSDAVTSICPRCKAVSDTHLAGVCPTCIEEMRSSAMAAGDDEMATF